MRIPKYAKALLIAFLVTAAFELTIRYFKPLLEQVQRVNASVEYGLRSVNISSISSRFFERLGADRYHHSILSPRAPFNLSEACGSRGQTSSQEVLRELCLRPAPAAPPERWHDFSATYQQALRGPGPVVDERKYPRSKVEYVLGVPDAFIHTFGCAWKGEGACGSFAYAERRSNWFGKLALILIVVLALGATAADAAEARHKPAGRSRLLGGVALFPAQLVLALIVVSFIGLAALLVLKALTALGLYLAGVVGGLALFPPAKWLLDAIRDEIKDKVSEKAIENREGDAAGKRPEA